MRPQNKNNLTKLITSVIVLIVILYGIKISSKVYAAAGIYEKINFQGKLVDADGVNVTDGNYTMDFTLYDAASAGTNVWTEEQTVAVADGIFRVTLGTVTPFDADVFDNDNLFMGIQVSNGTELSPRIRFTAAPYAMNAKKVNGLNVTNTDGTLTIPSGTTIAFSGANNLTFTTTGVTGVTLPTTGTLATLAGSEILTNKTIGSTGLTFSGATTDISTPSGEDLALIPGGTGNVGIGTTTASEKLHVSGAIMTTAASTTDNASGGLVGVANDDFLNGTLYLHNYGFGFYNPGSGMRSYVGGYSGIDFYTNANTTPRLAITGTTGLVTVATDLAVNAQGDVRLSDSDSSHYVALQSAATVGSNYTLTFPDALPAGASYALTSNSAGTLSWTDISGSTGDITAVGSMTSGAAFADGTADGDWLGLGAAAGRIHFTDAGTDVVSVLTGRFGVGTTGAAALIDSLGTTEQLRLSYDVSNYASFTTSASGDLTLAPSGSDFTLTGRGIIDADITTGSQLLVQGDMSGTGADQHAIRVESLVTAATASTRNYNAFNAVPQTNSANLSGASIVGYRTQPYIFGSASVGSVFNVLTSTNVDETAVVGSNYGFYLTNPTKAGGATITNNYGMRVEAQTAGGSDYGIRVDTADTQTLWIAGESDATTAAAGVAFGSSRDTNLYRSAANTLQTDDSLTLNGSGGAANLTLNTQGDLRLADTDSSAYVALQAAGTTTTYTLTLPGTVATGDNYALVSNSAGTMSWLDTASLGGGSGDITAVGSMTSGAAFADSSADGDWLGLGSGAGRLHFTDAGTDVVSVLTGRFGVGTTGAAALIDSLGTTEQLRLSYDVSNYASFTTSASGDLTLAPSGGDMNLTGTLDVSSNAAIGNQASIITNNALTVNNEYTSAANGDYIGIYNNTSIEPSGATDTYDAFGIRNILVSTTDQDVVTFNSLLSSSNFAGNGNVTEITGGLFQVSAGGSGTVTELGGLSTEVSNDGSSAVTNGYGASFSLLNNATGSMTYATAITATLESTSSNDITDAQALWVTNMALSGDGDITNLRGILIDSVTDTGAGAIVTNYGIHIATQTVGTSDYGARIDAADTQTLWLSGNADNTTAAAGIAFGSSRDTNLYRSAANTLQTDDTFTVSGGNITVTNQGDLRLLESGSTNYFALQAAASMDSDDVYTWPSDMPTAPGQVLSSNTAGALSWATAGGSVTVRESDASPSVTSVSTIEFGPATTSTDEFIVSDQTGGVVRVRTGNKVVLTDAAQELTNKTIGSTGLTFSGATTDITTGTDEALTFTPNGTGDTVISIDADTQLQITASAAPGVDMVALTNASQGTVTDGVDGLSLAFTQADDGDATDTNSALNITVTNSSGDADNVRGITINNITGGAATEYALVIGTGWDRGLSVASASNFSAAVTNTSTLNNEGTVVIGTGGNTFTFDPSAGVTYAGTARKTKTISLNPEYPGAVLSAFYGAGTDTNINGAVTSDTDTSGNLLRNFYQWSSSQGSLNYYTVAVRVRLPKDFSGWATSNAIQIDYSTQSTSAANNLVDVRIYNGDDTPGTAVTSSASNVSGVASTWTTVTIDDSSIDEGGAPDWDAADESAVIYIRMGSLSNNVVKIGDIRLNYLSSF